MKLGTIAGTTLKPSRFCLGTTNYGDKSAQEGAFQLLDTFVELGGNFIDTAKVYGTSEKVIGEWLKARGNRNSIIVGTKGAHPDLETMKIQRLSRAEIAQDIEESLVNLKTDYIDLYYLHRDDVDRPVEEIIDSLHGLQSTGKIRYFACSNWRRPRIEAAQAYARKVGIQGFVADQPGWSLRAVDLRYLFDPNMVVMDDDLQAYHAQSGMTVIPYSSQGGGFFQKLARRNPADRPAKPITDQVTAANEKRGERLLALSEETGITITHLVLAYLLSQPFPVIPIIGCKTPENLRESCNAASVRLDREQLRFLTAEDEC
jgi:aryl-alcohol dehydrogenase-like predicted oxidoreductase